MTKYTVAQERRAREAKERGSPIWRGIGCLMILFVPVLSYFLATMLVQVAVDQKWPLPYQLMGYPEVSKDLLKISSLTPLWNFIGAQANLYATLMFTVLFIVGIGALISFGYAMVYRFVGPPRYGPLDAPPPKIRTKAYKR